MTQGDDVWFASKEDGVSRFDKVTGEWTIYKQADFLADNDVRAITRGDGWEPLDSNSLRNFCLHAASTALGNHLQRGWAADTLRHVNIYEPSAISCQPSARGCGGIGNLFTNNR